MDLTLEIVEGNTLQLTQASNTLVLTAPASPSVIVEQPASGTVVQVMAGLRGPKGDPGDAGDIQWSAIQNKPTTFTPSAHNHDDRYYTESEIDTMLQGVSTGPVDWTDVENKPTTFTPSAHSHVIGDVTGLQSALDNKATTTHTHVIGDTTGLQAALDSKSGTGHNHTSSAITDFSTAVDNRINNWVGAAPAALDTLVEFGNALGNDPNFATTITNLIAGKANSVHTHAISDVTNLQSSLDAKAATSSVVTLTGAQSVGGVKTFSSAPVVPDSSFSIAKTTGLQTALDSKAATSHYHAAVEVNDSTVVGRNVLTAASQSAARTAIDAQQAGSYEPARTIVSQAEAEAGSSTEVRAWNAQRVAQAIAALSPSGGATTPLTLTQSSPTQTVLSVNRTTSAQELTTDANLVEFRNASGQLVDYINEEGLPRTQNARNAKTIYRIRNSGTNCNAIQITNGDGSVVVFNIAGDGTVTAPNIGVPVRGILNAGQNPAGGSPTGVYLRRTT